MAELEDALEALAAERRPEGMPQGVIRRKKSSGASQFYGPINYPLECTEGPPLSSGDPPPRVVLTGGASFPPPPPRVGESFQPFNAAIHFRRGPRVGGLPPTNGKAEFFSFLLQR